jgi:putative membrane-bound dehydrogenase-like protein
MNNETSRGIGPRLRIPGLRGTSYPGLARTTSSTLKGLRPRACRARRNPVGVVRQRTATQGSRFAPTLGFEAKSFWDFQRKRSKLQQQAGSLPHVFRYLLAVVLAIYNSPLTTAAAQRTDGVKTAEDIAGNEEVRSRIKQFQGRGQTVEAGGGVKALSPKESLERFSLSEGLEISLAANEPEVRQPLCINFDERGRMWVVQYIQYPFPAGLKVLKYDEHLRAVFDKVPAPPPGHVHGADKITIFEDKDGDGFYESHKDFVVGLNIATSALPGRGGVWVLNPPYLLFYPDRNHDDIPDGDPEVHLSGFGLEDTHAVANSLTWGPDGWIYGAQGSTCTATIRGIRFLGQAIWRYHPVRHEFELFAEGGGNTFCVEFDRKGRLYSGTNWGNQRGLYYVQGGYYVKSWGKHGPLTNPHAYGFFPHMTHQGDEARFSHSFILYEGSALPEKYFGRMLAIVPLQNRVQVAELLPDGSTYKTHDLDRAVQTSDKWFRPVDIKAGPDGAVYLADWYDIRLTHVDPRDNWDRSNGRIYRLTARGASPSKPFDFSIKSSDELVGLLSEPNKWTRQQALRLLGDRHDKSLVPKLQRLVDDEEGQLALEGLWALNLSGGFTDDFALRQLSHSDAFVRMWTVRLLGDAKTVLPKIEKRLVELARYEPEAQVRSQLASSAKRLPGQQALPIVSELLQHSEDIGDPHIPLLLWWAIERNTISNRKAVLAMLNTAVAWQQPMIAQHIMYRLVRRYAAEGKQTDLNTVADIMNKAPGRVERERLLAAVAEAFQGRKIENIPAGLRQAIAAVGGKAEPAVVLMKLRLGVGTDEDNSLALKFVRDEDEKIKGQRIEFINAIGGVGGPESIPALLEVVRSSRWHSVRKAALLALQHFSDPQIGREILTAYPRLPTDQGVRPQALDVLSKRQEWSLALLRAVEAGDIPPAEVPFEITERIKLHKDPTLAQLAQRLLGKARQTSKEKQDRMEQIAKILRRGQGAAAAGKEVFSATCAACHKLHGEGQTVGPDLTGYERDNLDFLLLAIVDPSAGIREEYTNFELETKDGLLLTGYVVERGPQSITIEDGQQGRTAVPKEKIKSLQASAVSRMPEELLDAMTEQQIRDLFAYLRSKSPAVARKTTP